MGCPGPFWQVDDVGRCQRQRYLVQYPIILVLLIALLYTVVSLFLSKKGRSIRLSDDFSASEAVWHEYAFHPPKASERDAMVTMRTRSFGDRLRINCEIVLGIGQCLLVLLLWTSPSVADQYSQWAPNTPLVLQLASLYAVSLAIYRKINEAQVEPLAGQPFAQCAYVYTALLFVWAVEWYSQTVHPYSLSSRRLATALLVVSSGQWLVLFTSPIGDSAARIYTTPGSTPSSEPTASLLRIIGCCWNSSMILQASRKTLEPSDVWELREENHAYVFFEEFARTRETLGFWLRVFIALRRPMFLNVFFGVVSALLALLPTMFVNLILRYIENPAAPRQVAWLYVFGLGFTHLLHTALVNQAYYQGRVLSLGIRGLIIGSVYNKALYRQVSVHTTSDEEPNKKDDEEEKDAAEFDPNSVGAVINLMSVDSFKVADFFSYLHDNFASPAILVVSIYYLYKVVGFSALAGVIVMVLSLPVSYYLGSKFSETQNSLMSVTDRRIEKTNEFLHAIRVIKIFAWENKFVDSIMSTRNKELYLLYWRYLWWMGESFMFFLMPVLIIASTFWSYVYIQGNVLTSSVAFTALAIFQILRFPLDDLANLITRVTSCRVSAIRIARYLSEPESPKYSQVESDGDKLGFENASFSWSSPSDDSQAAADTFRLRNIDVQFVVGDLNVIIGPTGSGKTSLLMALLGEMNKEQGRVFLPTGDRRLAGVNRLTGLANTVAYAPQQPWLVNDTIKNNILFAAPFDKARYESVLDACELRRDLEILSAGDQTLIGDKGISLSGGQKQRVSLARVMYSNSRHLILDDCLSAVDSHTAEALYNNALTGPIAANRTVILVSHNVALTVGKAAHIVAISDGRVTASGSPQELSAAGSLGDDDLIRKNVESGAISRTNSAANLAALKHRVTPEEQLQETARRLSMSQESRSVVRSALTGGDILPPDPNPDQNLVASLSDSDPQRVSPSSESAVLDEESRAVGSISWRTYWRYIRELGGVTWAVLAVFVLLAAPLAEYGESWWIKQWAGAGIGSHKSFSITTKITAMTAKLTQAGVPPDVAQALMWYAKIYLLIGFTYAVLGTGRDVVFYLGSIIASRSLFRALLETVSRAKVRFFDATPTGRIVNRFSKDIETIDQELIIDLVFLVMSVIDSATISVVISFVTPEFIPAAIVIAYLFTIVGKAYLACSRELKRMESTSRSPIFQQFGETLSGAVVIRAFDDTPRFERDNWNLVDGNHRSYFYLWLANRWLAFWSAFMAMLVCVMAAFFVIWNFENISAGMAGISLSYAMGFGDAILWIVRMYSQTEISMNSVERVGEYLEIDQEAPAILPESRPPANWPQKGAISFKNLSLRYADDLPLVIKDVSFEVAGGLKIGIVGRTGAGKSTIITALFRLLEPAGGSVEIDGLDITTIGLTDLRRALAIIPQDPTLFRGSLRSNLDMFGEYGDDDIFRALAHVKLVPDNTTAESAAKALVEQQEASGENVNKFLNLDSEVQEGGSNLSQGQRQLICLARSILKEPRILLLDEATASIDYDTDAMIQSTIRTAFSNVTILTIAHRLRTIADYDRILVLEKGEVAQFGTPADLLRDKDGIFWSMCAKSGELEALVALANHQEVPKKA